MSGRYDYGHPSPRTPGEPRDHFKEITDRFIKTEVSKANQVEMDPKVINAQVKEANNLVRDRRYLDYHKKSMEEWVDSFNPKLPEDTFPSLADLGLD